MSIDDKRYKELVVTIKMNGRKSARRRKISPPPKPDPNLKQTTKLLPPSPTKLCISNISPKIDNKGLKSPMRAPKLIQSKHFSFQFITSKCNCTNGKCLSNNNTWESYTLSMA